MALVLDRSVVASYFPLSVDAVLWTPSSGFIAFALFRSPVSVTRGGGDDMFFPLGQPFDRRETRTLRARTVGDFRCAVFMRP